MEYKTCTKCKEEKPATSEYFSRLKNGLNGLRAGCKVCQQEYKKQWDEANREQMKEYCKQYYKTNPEWHRERARQYQKANREKIKKRMKRYREENLSARMAASMRVRIWKVLKGRSKAASVMNLIGCTIKELMQHLEAQFMDGMTWENYGPYSWHIDHIVPCAAFDLTDPEQQKACFHYTNLQPLWAEDNMSKNDKLPHEWKEAREAVGSRN